MLFLYPHWEQEDFRRSGKEHKKQGGSKGVSLSAQQLRVFWDKKHVWMILFKWLTCLDYAPGQQETFPGIHGFYLL